MKPTVGDGVLFTFTRTGVTSDDGQSKTVPAIVVNVFSEELVNLRVFQDGPAIPLWLTSVQRKDTLPDNSDASYWEWPAIT